MQETKELTTPNNHLVLVRGYITGLIDQEVKKILLNGNKMSYAVDVSSNEPLDPNNPPEDSKLIVNTDPTVEIDADNKLLELMLLAIDGNNGGDLVKQLLDFPAADYQYVLKEVQAIKAASEVSDEQKKA